MPSIGTEHEQRKLRTERRVKIGRVITTLYYLPQEAAASMVPGKGDTLPGDTGTAPLKPYFYQYHWGDRVGGNRIELFVDWILPEAYS